MVPGHPGPVPHVQEALMDADDLILWPDGTWCFRHELPQYGHMSDDYRTIPVDTDEYEEFFS